MGDIDYLSDMNLKNENDLLTETFLEYEHSKLDKSFLN